MYKFLSEMILQVRFSSDFVRIKTFCLDPDLNPRPSNLHLLVKAFSY